MVKSLSSIGFTLGSLVLAVGITACAGDDVSDTGGYQEVKLTLVSYAVTQNAYSNIIPKFVEQWREKTGQNVVFDQSYAGSGTQTRAVLDGLEADIVALAIPLDTLTLEEAGLIKAGWQQRLPNNATVHSSVIALVPRDETVKVTGWADLTRNDIQVITANPKTSGGARWNFLGLWGAITQAGGSEQEAEKFVTTVYKNVPILPKDARESTDVFYKQGQGNVLMNYENEVVLARQQGENLNYFVPTDYNISIDNPVAIVDVNVDKHGTREVAEAFTQFLFTPEAQREFAKSGFRPSDPTVAQEFSEKYPPIENIFTVEDLGGWDEVQSRFFDDGGIFDKIMAK